MFEAKGSATSFGAGHSVAVDGAGNAYFSASFPGSVTLGTLPISSTTSAGYVAKVDPTGKFVWARAFTSDNNLTPYAVGLDGAGDVYAAGGFGGKALGGLLTSAGSNDGFVIKLMPNGLVVWARSLGGATTDAIAALAVDGSGTAYVTGSFSGTVNFGSNTLVSSGQTDVFAAKLNSAGTVLWAHAIGGPSPDNGLGVAIDPGGDVYVAGAVKGLATFGPGVTLQAGVASGFVAKLTGLGDLIWAHLALSSGSTTTVAGVVVDGAGNVYAAGIARGTVDFDPGPATYNLTLSDYDAFVW